jgi:hypothetical protein
MEPCCILPFSEIEGFFLPSSLFYFYFGFSAFRLFGFPSELMLTQS